MSVCEPNNLFFQLSCFGQCGFERGNILYKEECGKPGRPERGMGESREGGGTVGWGQGPGGKHMGVQKGGVYGFGVGGGGLLVPLYKL